MNGKSNLNCAIICHIYLHSAIICCLRRLNGYFSSDRCFSILYGKLMPILPTL
ncbi:MAG: hypothetical protein ACKPIV_02255 [Dolichospermum sp.]